MRDASQLALSALLGAALAALATAASAQDAPPTWRPPTPIVSAFGAGPVAAPAAADLPHDDRIAQSDVALRSVFTFSFPATDTLDAALAARGYSATSTAVGVDLALTARATGWLFLGARVGSRWRAIQPVHSDSLDDGVDVAGVEVLAVSELRIPLGGFELAPDVAAGLAYAEVLEDGASVARAAPRFSLGMSASLWLSDPVRVVARLGWDLYQVTNVNGFGHDTNLGGPTFDIGLEWRPR